ncbi:MAG: TolC family protein, partial [Spirochaetota bacterium]
EKQMSVYFDTAVLSPSAADFDALLGKALADGYMTVEFSKTESAKIIDMSLSRYAAAQSVYANKLLPQLNVTGGVTRTNGATSATVSVPDTDYSVGFSFSYALGNDAAEADLQTVKIKLQDIKYEYEATENSYRKSLHEYQQTAAGIKERLTTYEEMMKALSLQLAAEKRKYNQGRLSLSDVISTEQGLASARNEILNLKYSLISTYIDYCDLVR